MTGTVIALSFIAGFSLQAAVPLYNWTGAVDSDYLNAANWNVSTFAAPTVTSPATVAPGGTSDIRLMSAPTNRVLNLNYTGAGPMTYQIYGIQAGVSLGYTINFSGTSNGWLTYNIVGRGTHPYATDATLTLTGSSANRLGFFINLGSYSKITFDGSPYMAMAGTSGLTYAKIAMKGNSMIDASGMTNITNNTTTPPTTLSGAQVGIGGLNMEAGTSLNLGAYIAYINGLNLAGEQQIWAGHIFSTSTGTTVNYGLGVTRVATTGAVDLPGGFLLRSGGSYLVDGVHNGPISTTAGTNSILGGTGIVNGALTISSGTSIAPAGKAVAGRLTVNGNVSLNGALSIDMLSATDYDVLALNGTLTLGLTTANASSLAVGISDTFPLIPAAYRVLQVTNGNIVNSFATIALPGSSWSYVMGADYIDIIYTQRPFIEKYPLVGNNLLLGAFADNAILAGTMPAGLVDSMNRKDVIFFKGVIGQLSPTPYYGWYPAAVVRASALVKTLDDRIDQRGERPVHSLETYTFSSRQESSINTDANIGTDYTNIDTSSILGGADYVVSPLLTVGGLLNYALTHTDLDLSQSVSSTQSYTGALYAQHRRGDWQFQAVGFMGVDDYTARRNVANTTLATWARAKTNGSHFGGSVSGAYTYRLPWIEIMPTVGLQALDWKADGFTETEAKEASLVVAKQYEVSLSGRVGLRLAQSYPTARGFIRPFVSINLQHEFFSGDRTMKATLWGEKLSVKAPGIQEQGLHLDAGIDYDITHALSMQLRYSIEHGGAVDESVGVRGGLNVTF
jgi:uncharacterized protein with beta-barrel porin domain